MTANELNFRRMQMKDIPFVSAMEKRFFTTPWDKESLEKGLQSCNEIFWIAQKCGVDIGYIGYTCAFETVDILTVCIDPDYRRNGYAFLLLTFALEQMQKDGAEKVFLEVRESNAAARALYEKLNFAYLSKRANYYRDPLEDAFVMVKEMSQ